MDGKNLLKVVKVEKIDCINNKCNSVIRSMSCVSSLLYRAADLLVFLLAGEKYTFGAIYCFRIICTAISNVNHLIVRCFNIFLYSIP